MSSVLDSYTLVNRFFIYALHIFHVNVYNFCLYICCHDIPLNLNFLISLVGFYYGFCAW